LEKAFTKLERESGQEIQLIRKECEILAANLDGQGDEMQSLKKHLQDSGASEALSQYRKEIQALKKQLKQAQEELQTTQRRYSVQSDFSKKKPSIDRRISRSPSPRRESGVDLVPKKPTKRSVTPTGRSRSPSPVPQATNRLRSPRAVSPRPPSPKPPKPVVRNTSTEKRRPSPSSRGRLSSGSESELQARPNSLGRMSPRREKVTTKKLGGLSVRDPNRQTNGTTRTSIGKKPKSYVTTSEEDSGTESERPPRRRNKMNLHYTYTDESDAPKRITKTQIIKKKNMYESSDSEMESNKENKLYNKQHKKR
jgi:gas vesicle protein